MSCNFPLDTVSTWGSKNEILGTKYKRYYNEIKERLLSSRKVFIFGDPGMGKTTILLNISRELREISERYLPIYMDLSSDKSFTEEFWFYVRNSRIVPMISGMISSRRREIGYTKWEQLKKDFETWMKSRCRNSQDPLIRLYSLNFQDCKVYDGLDGIVTFLSDLSALNLSPVLLMDEARGEHFFPFIHKLVNSGQVYLAVASPTGVLATVKDEAVLRRIRENFVQLDPLKLEDAVEILLGMCKEIGKDLAETVYDHGMTIAQLITEAKSTYRDLLYECKQDLSCVEENVKKHGQITEIQKVSKEMESIVRECLVELKDELGIERVFETGKKVTGNRSSRNIDIVFVSHSYLFLGDVKLTNGEVVKGNSMENVMDVIGIGTQEVEREKYAVGGVIVFTNGKVFDFPGFTVNLPNKTIWKALREGRCVEELKDNLKRQLESILRGVAMR